VTVTIRGIDWPGDLTPILGGIAAVATRDLKHPCRGVADGVTGRLCGGTRFLVVERGDGRVSVQCERCRPARGLRVAGVIEMGG
jgi:hypothetical protein